METRRTQIFLIAGACLLTGAPDSRAESAPGLGGIRLIEDYLHQSLQGIDSTVGRILNDGRLEIQLETGSLPPESGISISGGQFSDRPEQVPERKPNGDDAKAAAAKWLDGLDGKGIVLNERVEEGGFVVTHGQGALGPVTKFNLRQSGWRVSLAFHGELSAGTSLETLRNEFWYITLDRVPTPGLDLPGWEIWPQTPSSSVKDGVEILAFEDGAIALRVRTGCFALYGRDPSVRVPADAKAPPGSYFQIRREIPLELTLEAPFVFRK